MKNLAYDGLGRLARVQSPFPTLGSPDLRSERFYYDGIRRLQEVVTDPLDDTSDSLMAGGGAGAAAAAALAAEPELDGSVATLGVESEQGDSPSVTVTLAREYVWGPGDNGVDELLAQYDHNRAPTWVIQDAGLDVVALCDLAGGAARVVWQGVYDAYGSVLSAESLYTHAPLRAGHKGLFFDRLDAGAVDPLTGIEIPRLAVGAKLIGYGRHRHYRPDLGRWLQVDPNATGAILQQSVMQGRAMANGIEPFDLLELHGDGSNLYQYLGSGPWARFDPMGLAWDPFDDADAYLAESAGSQARFMDEIVTGFDSMAHIGWQIAQFHPAVALAVSAYQAANGAPMSAAMLLSLVPGGKALSLVGSSYSTYSKGKRALKGARQLADDVLELHHVVPEFMLGWRSAGRVVALPRQQHQLYHRILDDALRTRRMPISNQGRDAWLEWLRLNPGQGDSVRSAMVESVEQFKKATGIDMMGDLWFEMSKQGWMLR